ncbi:hypothetical protein [Deinococcus sp.]|uniref:hypothetical protein n=1 Tax=Deinococcus sp. TaxID=47478 RepID=UPI003B5BAFBD
MNPVLFKRKLLLSGFSWVFLAACAPVADAPAKVPGKEAVSGQATEKDGVLTFTMTNVSRDVIGAESEYCKDNDPQWEIRDAGGNIYIPPPETGAPQIVYCVLPSGWGTLAPGESLKVVRKTYLPSGQYTIKSSLWRRVGDPSGSPSESILVEAPTITVTVP